MNLIRDFAEMKLKSAKNYRIITNKLINRMFNDNLLNLHPILVGFLRRNCKQNFCNCCSSSFRKKDWVILSSLSVHGERRG